MFVKQESIQIDAPPSAVYDYVSDIARHPEWAAQKLTMRALGDGRFESLMTMGAMKAVAVIHVETADRPKTFSYVADDNVSGPHRWTFTIEPEGAGSKVTFRMERMHEALVARIMQPVVMWPLIGHPGVLKGLARIKSHVEATNTQPRVVPTA